MNIVEAFMNAIKKSFTFAGRANRLEFWTYYIAYLLVMLAISGISAVLAGVAEALGMIMGGIAFIVTIAGIIPLISVSVRRLHDLGLSGFWLWYLNPFGLPIIFIVYLLDLDNASNLFIEKISKVGSPWLGWILTVLFFPMGAPLSLMLLSLYKGKREENQFGPSTEAAEVTA